MKPGDLVRISDHEGYFPASSPIGILLEIEYDELCANPYLVLVEGELRWCNPFGLMLMQTRDENVTIGS